MELNKVCEVDVVYVVGKIIVWIIELIGWFG